MKLLICLPTFNEIASIAEMVERIRAQGLEVFISDGGSTDGTREKAVELDVPIVERSGKGKGFGVQAALQYAEEQEADFLGLIDCDGSYFPEDFPKLMAFLPEADLIVGCRPFREIAFGRRMANLFMTYFMRGLFAYPYRDIASGMRILRVSAFAGKLDAKGFEIEPQISGQAVRRGLHIKDVDIRYGERAGESKVRPIHLIHALRQMIRDRHA